MKKKILYIFLILAVMINFGLTLFLIGKVNKIAAANPDIKYTLYVGLNDKDTYRQEISDSDALEIVDSVCTKYVSGYTLSEATGMWVDEEGEDTQEKTIVCYFYETDEKTIRQIADDLKKELDQNVILVEKSNSDSYYY